MGVELKTVRTSINFPYDLHQRLHEIAANRGCSVKQLILQSMEQLAELPARQPAKGRLNLDPPIVPSTGKPFTLTNDQIYDLLEFP